MGGFGKSLIHAHLTKQSYTNNTPYQSSQIYAPYIQLIFSKLDVCMQYYTFELDKPSQEIYFIVMLFGKYTYKQLPMGLKCTLDIAKQVMEEILCDIDTPGAYLDDVGAFSITWEHHILLLDKILHWLKVHCFIVNPLKYEWATQEIDLLGCWLRPTGSKQWCKKLWYPTNSKPKKPITNTRVPWCCQSLLMHVAPVHTHSYSAFQQVWKENLLLDYQNRPSLHHMKALMA